MAFWMHLGCLGGHLGAQKMGRRSPSFEHPAEPTPKLYQNGIEMGSETDPRMDQIRSAQKNRFPIDFWINFLSKKQIKI